MTYKEAQKLKNGQARSIVDSMQINPVSYYGYSARRPDLMAKVVVITPPLWKRLWYGFTEKLYEFFLIFMMAVAFTGILYAPLVSKLLYSLIME